jgi:hypothetical protein
MKSIHPRRLARAGRRFDVILTAGNRSLSQLRRALTPRLSFVGGRRRRWFGGTIASSEHCVVTVQALEPRFFIATDAERPLFPKQLIEAGKVTPVIDRTYPLSEAPGDPVAQEKSRSGKGRHHRRVLAAADSSALADSVTFIARPGVEQ